jgi:hypothetical protein
MSVWLRPLFFFSIALNIAFVSVAATRVVRERQAAPFEPGPPHDAARMTMLERWRDNRREVLARVLQLDAAQRAQWDAGFARLAPALQEARARAFAARDEYRVALVRGDAEELRGAARRVSRAQAGVDSVCAEAMASEVASLRPDQRLRYVRWTLRAGRGPHGPGAGPRPFGPP